MNIQKRIELIKELGVIGIDKPVDPIGRIMIPKPLRKHYKIFPGEIFTIFAIDDGIFIQNANNEKIPAFIRDDSYQQL